MPKGVPTPAAAGHHDPLYNTLPEWARIPVKPDIELPVSGIALASPRLVRWVAWWPASTAGRTASRAASQWG